MHLSKRVLIFMMGLLLFMPAAVMADGIKAGTYSGVSQGLRGPVAATVTIDAQGKILAVKIEAAAETEGIGAEAAKRLAADILKYQTINVDAISGATTTADAAKEAVSKALAAAGINVAAMGKAKVEGPAEEATVDVVIVGAGTSGTGAALAATEAGAKVMVLEKLGKVGGLGTTGMGLLATNSSLQKAAKQTVTTEQIFKHLAVYNHYRMNGALTRAILDKSGSTIDWLQAKGIGLRLGLGIDQKAHLDYPKTYHMWTNSAKDFPAVYEMMAKKYGLQLRLNTRGTNLIKDASGRIAGVEAAKADGGKLTVHAKAVILCTGGFGGDSEMLKAQASIDAYNYFGLGNQGDGVQMAWAAGADKFGDHAMQIHLADLAGSKFIGDGMDNSVFQVKDVPLLWVNREGVRFVDESVCYDNVLWGNATYSVGGEYFAIVDQASLDKFAKEGIKLTGAYQMNGSGLMHPQGGNDTNVTIAPQPKLADDMAKLIASGGVAYKADDLAGLAAATGMNPRKLAETVDRYNKAVRAKKDDLFYKKAEYLKYPVSKGPFYAVRVRGSAYGSIGGVRINESIEALKADGSPIPALYVAGADAGGMYDNSYPDLEGLTMSFAMNSGRIAGENAAAFALKK